MRKSAMQDIHNMNQRALNSYAEHQLNSLKSQFGTGQGSTNKKPVAMSNRLSLVIWCSNLVMQYIRYIVVQ